MALRTPLSPERELRLRIALTVLLVVLLPFALVHAFLYVLNTVGIAMLEWVTGRAWYGRFYVDPLLLAVVVLGGLAFQYRYGPGMILGSVGARSASESAYPELHAAVTRLAQQADLPTPAVRVVDTDLPNAFAVGTPGRGTVVVSTGLLELLDGDERDAVVAHELAHLKNRDSSLMTVAWVLPAVTYYLAMAAYTVLAGLARALGNGHSGSNDGRGLAVVVAVVVVSGVVTLSISALFWVASVLVHRVLSRYREFAADRGAAEITGSPAALASALGKIDDTMPEVPDRDLRRYDGGAEALYLAPLESRSFDSHELVSTDVFPDTHPPTAERIDRLRTLAGDAE
ncbi:M48 family metalloprotease [Halostella litorea]|uniref:M48 family metalloprotease n=1 Tax=Halostella litorea TaxID=2528831 RepID=UPI001F02B07C|nr:M48 family metalloprotease [Halostella litorea]